MTEDVAMIRRSTTASLQRQYPVQQLEQEVSAGFRSNVLLDGSLRQLADPNVPASQVSLPAQLTSQNASLEVSIKSMSGSSATVVILARLSDARARQTLRFQRAGDRWIVHSADLD